MYQLKSSHAESLLPLSIIADFGLSLTNGGGGFIWMHIFVLFLFPSYLKPNRKKRVGRLLNNNNNNSNNSN